MTLLLWSVLWTLSYWHVLTFLFSCILNLQVNNSKSAIILKFDGKEIYWETGENLIQKLESENIIKQVFPLHGIFFYSRAVKFSLDLVSLEVWTDIAFDW